MKLVKEHIVLEKFEEKSDPISDLGIGFIKFLKKERDKAGKRISEESSIIYFGTSKYRNEALIVYVVLDKILKQINRDEQINVQKAFEEALIHTKDWYENLNIEKIVYALKNTFDIDVT